MRFPGTGRGDASYIREGLLDYAEIQQESEQTEKRVSKAKIRFLKRLESYVDPKLGEEEEHQSIKNIIGQIRSFSGTLVELANLVREACDHIDRDYYHECSEVHGDILMQDLYDEKFVIELLASPDVMNLSSNLASELLSLLYYHHGSFVFEDSTKEKKLEIRKQLEEAFFSEGRPITVDHVRVLACLVSQVEDRERTIDNVESLQFLETHKDHILAALDSFSEEDWEDLFFMLHDESRAYSETFLYAMDKVYVEVDEDRLSEELGDDVVNSFRSLAPVSKRIAKGFDMLIQKNPDVLLELVNDIYAQCYEDTSTELDVKLEQGAEIIFELIQNHISRKYTVFDDTFTVDDAITPALIAALAWAEAYRNTSFYETDHKRSFFSCNTGVDRYKHTVSKKNDREYNISFDDIAPVSSDAIGRFEGMIREYLGSRTGTAHIDVLYETLSKLESGSLCIDLLLGDTELVNLLSSEQLEHLLTRIFKEEKDTSKRFRVFEFLRYDTAASQKVSDAFIKDIYKEAIAQTEKGLTFLLLKSVLYNDRIASIVDISKIVKKLPLFLDYFCNLDDLQMVLDTYAKYPEAMDQDDIIGVGREVTASENTLVKMPEFFEALQQALQEKDIALTDFFLDVLKSSNNLYHAVLNAIESLDSVDSTGESSFQFLLQALQQKDSSATQIFAAIAELQGFKDKLSAEQWFQIAHVCSNTGTDVFEAMNRIISKDKLRTLFDEYTDEQKKRFLEDALSLQPKYIETILKNVQMEADLAYTFLHTALEQTKVGQEVAGAVKYVVDTYASNYFSEDQKRNLIKICRDLKDPLITKYIFENISADVLIDLFDDSYDPEERDEDGIASIPETINIALLLKTGMQRTATDVAPGLVNRNVVSSNYYRDILRKVVLPYLQQEATSAVLLEALVQKGLVSELWESGVIRYVVDTYDSDYFSEDQKRKLIKTFVDFNNPLITKYVFEKISADVLIDLFDDSYDPEERDEDGIASIPQTIEIALLMKSGVAPTATDAFERVMNRVVDRSGQYWSILRKLVLPYLQQEATSTVVLEGIAQRGKISDLLELAKLLYVQGYSELYDAVVTIPNFDQLIGYMTTSDRFSMALMYGGDKFDDAFLTQLRSLQGQSSNRDHDIWKNVLDPMIARENININEPQDQDMLLTYIKLRGAMYDPVYFYVFKDVYQANRFEDLSEETIVRLEEIGIRIKKHKKQKDGTFKEMWRYPSPKSLLNEIEKKRGRMMDQLFENQVPREITSRLGYSEFQRLLAVTSFKRNINIAKVVEARKEALVTNPELATLPEGYQQERITVLEKVSQHGEKTDAQLELEWKEKHAEDVQRIDTQMNRIHTHATKLEALEHADDWKQYVHRYVRAWMIMRPRDTEHVETEHVEMYHAIQAFLDFLVKLSSESHGSEKKASDAYLVCMEYIQEHLVPVLPNEIADELCQIVSIAHVLNLYDVSVRQKTDEHIESDESVKSRYIRYANFLRDLMWEHYLHSDQTNTEHTGHQAMSQELYERLLNVWDVVPSKEDGRLPIEPVVQKLEKTLRAKHKQLKQVEIDMIPNAGLLNVFAGNLGDGCHSNMIMDTAAGKFPNLHTWVFVTNRGKSSESWRGSTIGIETERVDGVPALVVRANNPKENFVMGIDAEEFVLQTLLVYIDTARRMWEARGKKGQQCVTLPMDRRSQSCTNRQAVYDTYAKYFASLKNKRVALKDEPATNYNGYNLASPHSESSTAVIWEIDENGRETFFGNWPEKLLEEYREKQEKSARAVNAS